MLSRFSRVQLFAMTWTVAHQAPLSMGFSRQENWNEPPFLSPGDPPDARIKPMDSSSLSQVVKGSIKSRAQW